MTRKAKTGADAPMDFLSQILDSDTNIADEGKSAGENTGYIDTGCFALNLQLSGSIFGGVPNNRITVFAGEEATGKTYLVRSILKHAQQADPGLQALAYDTESAWAKKELMDSGIDTKRTALADKQTIQEVTWHALATVNKYKEFPAKQRPQMIFVLDSLANLASLKEMEDATAQKDTRDMTKSQLIRGMFRKLNLPLAKARIPWLITNHTYDIIGAYVPTKKQSGGGGIAYNASMALFLYKSKDKDEKTKEVKGNFIRSVAVKNRFAKQWTEVELKLDYATGLDRYYGLIDLACKHGLSQKRKLGNRVKYAILATDADEDTVLEKELLINPEKYLTPEWLEKFEEVVSPHFRYGVGEGPELDEEDEENLGEPTRETNFIELITE